MKEKPNLLIPFIVVCALLVASIFTLAFMASNAQTQQGSISQIISEQKQDLEKIEAEKARAQEIASAIRLNDNQDVVNEEDLEEIGYALSYWLPTTWSSKNADLSITSTDVAKTDADALVSDKSAILHDGNTGFDYSLAHTATGWHVIPLENTAQVKAAKEADNPAVKQPSEPEVEENPSSSEIKEETKEPTKEETQAVNSQNQWANISNFDVSFNIEAAVSVADDERISALLPKDIIDTLMSGLESYLAENNIDAPNKADVLIDKSSIKAKDNTTSFTALVNYPLGRSVFNCVYDQARDGIYIDLASNEEITELSSRGN